MSSENLLVDDNCSDLHRTSESDTMATLFALSRLLCPKHKQRRARRWLNNARINVHHLYKPLIQTALADWQDECIDLSLDTSLFWDKYCLIRLAVVHHGRAVPVVWRVIEHGSSSILTNMSLISFVRCCVQMSSPDKQYYSVDG